jgi:hypothetical protein
MKIIFAQTGDKAEMKAALWSVYGAISDIPDEFNNSNQSESSQT